MVLLQIYSKLNVYCWDAFRFDIFIVHYLGGYFFSGHSVYLSSKTEGTLATERIRMKCLHSASSHMSAQMLPVELLRCTQDLDEGFEVHSH